mmetsp:Transcript_19989/g.25961  ORF Transcript_19989/g.25961 Transcript_19989/m.25961 type:complete len:1270 (+) Transcript_19989:335-4144(+)
MGVLEILDPRKSRDLRNRKQTNKIIVDGSKDTFETTNLQGALKVAASISKKKSSKVLVTLPALDIPVQSTISIPNGVKIVGQTNYDADRGSTLVVSSSVKGSFISLAGKEGCLANCQVVLPKVQSGKDAVFKVDKGKHLRVVECVIGLEDADTDGAKLREGFAVQGTLEIVACQLSGLNVVFDKTGSGSITDSVLSVPELKEKNDLERCGISIVSASEDAVTITNSEVIGFSHGVLVASPSSPVSLTGTTVEALKCALDFQLGRTTVDSCTFVAQTRTVKGSAAFCEMSNCKIMGDNVGIALENEAQMKLSSCTISNVGKLGVRVESLASLAMTSTTISGASSGEVNGIQIKDGSVVLNDDCKLENLTGVGVVCQGTSGVLNFNKIKVSNVAKGCIQASHGVQVTGRSSEFLDNSEVVIGIHNVGTVAHLEDIKITGGTVGLLIRKGANVTIKNLNINETSEKGIDITDASVNLVKAQLSSAGTHGIVVKFKNKPEEAHNVYMRAATVRKSTLVALKVTQEGDDEALAAATSQCKVDNSAFLESKVGVHVDGARLLLQGCSCIFNKEKSIMITRIFMMEPKRDVNLSKEANFKMKWANFVEPMIPQGEECCNDMEIFHLCTAENNFFGAFDWEYSMYVNTMVERIRQARTKYKQDGAELEEGRTTARVIMNSIEHMTLLLPAIREPMLSELVDDPDLGMFATTFPLKDEGQPRKTVISMDQLFESWEKLQDKKPSLFDKAITALDSAFKKKDITDEIYDQWFTKLEEMQRVCYVTSKFSRRREHLFSTAKQDPLTTWYFLDKESPDTDEGKRLRRDILEHLASGTAGEANKEEVVEGALNVFHVSWIAQWAQNLLGKPFVSSDIPEDPRLREAWANMLLDNNQCKRLINEYTKISEPRLPHDDLLKFEAYDYLEGKGQKVNLEDFKKLFSNASTMENAVQEAARLFEGVGALPGFLRRQADKHEVPEHLLSTLSPVNSLPNVSEKHRSRTVLAVMHHRLFPDSTVPPPIYKPKSDGYETCQMCLVRKLQPWNELKLSSCKQEHHFCRWCMRDSMSATSRGCCPGRDDHGMECGAKATRREMERAGMEPEVIYSIIEDRIRDYFSNIPGWNQCDSRGCIGGKSNVQKSFYRCRLCQKMVTEDGGASDPTIPLKLLQGLDASSIMRGEGVFRECYHCASRYEKGNACSTITCAQCHKQFNMTFGNDQMTHRFDEQGIGPQRYVPLKEGMLWKLGVFKDRKGKPLTLGQSLTEAQAAEVVRRAKLKIPEFDG